MIVYGLLDIIYFAPIIIVMIIILSLCEGWVKGLLILLSCFLSFLFVHVVMHVIGCERDSFTIANYLLGGIWAVGLALYNIINRYSDNTRLPYGG